MEWLLYAAVATLIVLVLVVKALRSAQNTKFDFNYQQQSALFTAAERSFLGVLDKAVGDRYRVFGKIRVADLLRPARGLDKRTWTSLFNRIKAKHVDFVLCDPGTLDVKAVVELNDKSHAKSKRSSRDSFLRAACASANLRLIEVPAQRTYSSELVRQLLSELEERLNDPMIGKPGSRIEPTF